VNAYNGMPAATHMHEEQITFTFLPEKADVMFLGRISCGTDKTVVDVEKNKTFYVFPN